MTRAVSRIPGEVDEIDISSTVVFLQFRWRRDVRYNALLAICSGRDEDTTQPRHGLPRPVIGPWGLSRFTGASNCPERVVSSEDAYRSPVCTAS